MSKYEYDLFVIGAGSGGVRAARMAAAQGVRVAVAEQSKAGGTCVNLGCVPKKLYVHASEFVGYPLQASGFGWTLKAESFDWTTLRDNKSTLIAQANQRMEKMLSDAGAEFIHGRAQVASPHEVIVSGKTYSCERILIATGSTPTLPDIPGNDLLLTSDQIFDLEALPKEMIIIGGGYIACEFAGIFQQLGVKVTQLYRGDLFLRGFDEEIRRFVAEGMRDKGINLRFNTDIREVKLSDQGRIEITLSDGEKIETDIALTATGRHPNTSGLGIDEVGVETDERGAIIVDPYYQSTVPSIFALGDVIDRIQLTPVALAEAMTLVRNLYQGTRDKLNYNLIATAVFSLPTIACVGLTEEQAMAEFPRVDVYTNRFRPLKYALGQKEEQILMKLLVDAESDRVVGAHMAGEGAAETIQGIAIALKAGATKAIFDQTVGIHPTSAEEFVTMRTVTRSHGKN